MVVTKVATGMFVVRLGCLEASTENTREEGKQEVKLKESWD
jgi:hypothetical protein